VGREQGLYEGTSGPCCSHPLRCGIASANIGYKALPADISCLATEVSKYDTRVNSARPLHTVSPIRTISCVRASVTSVLEPACVRNAGGFFEVSLRITSAGSDAERYRIPGLVQGQGQPSMIAYMGFGISTMTLSQAQALLPVARLQQVFARQSRCWKSTPCDRRKTTPDCRLERQDPYHLNTDVAERSYKEAVRSQTNAAALLAASRG